MFSEKKLFACVYAYVWESVYVCVCEREREWKEKKTISCSQSQSFATQEKEKTFLYSWSVAYVYCISVCVKRRGGEKKYLGYKRRYLVLPVQLTVCVCSHVIKRGRWNWANNNFFSICHLIDCHTIDFTCTCTCHFSLSWWELTPSASQFSDTNKPTFCVCVCVCVCVEGEKERKMKLSKNNFFSSAF